MNIDPALFMCRMLEKKLLRTWAQSGREDYSLYSIAQSNGSLWAVGEPGPELHGNTCVQTQGQCQGSSSIVLPPLQRDRVSSQTQRPPTWLVSIGSLLLGCVSAIRGWNYT